MRADTKPYPPTSVVGAIVLSRLDVLPGCHALDIEAVGLVTGQLDRLPSRGEYKKVIHCDIWDGTYGSLGHMGKGHMGVSNFYYMDPGWAHGLLGTGVVEHIGHEVVGPTATCDKSEIHG